MDKYCDGITIIIIIIIINAPMGRLIFLYDSTISTGFDAFYYYYYDFSIR